MKRYVIQDKEAGNVIEYFETIEEAKKQLAQYEQSDKDEGIYEENFYEIWDNELEERVD